MHQCAELSELSSLGLWSLMRAISELRGEQETREGGTDHFKENFHSLNGAGNDWTQKGKQASYVPFILFSEGDR